MLASRFFFFEFCTLSRVNFFIGHPDETCCVFSCGSVARSFVRSLEIPVLTFLCSSIYALLPGTSFFLLAIPFLCWRFFRFFSLLSCLDDHRGPPNPSFRREGLPRLFVLPLVPARTRPFFIVLSVLPMPGSRERVSDRPLLSRALSFLWLAFLRFDSRYLRPFAFSPHSTPPHIEHFAVF